MLTDLTFITNQDGQTLKDRFLTLIKDTQFFDILVGYFYLSGFYLLYPSLEKTEKIRILIGIGTEQKAFEFLKNAQQLSLFSHYQTKNAIRDFIKYEMDNSEDSKDIEEGIKKFIEWIANGKLQIRAYPSKSLHAKLYIMTFKEGDRDVGRVITGSSNFTYSGLVDNLEFNVELKNRADYEYAKAKFEELWNEAVDVSQDFVITLKENTWLNENITPYEIYLKTLYEYFKEDLETIDDIYLEDLPENFKQLEYQKQAVLNAKKILEKYGGVFISDVVGLGKTYIAALLAKQLDGKTLVIAPPKLIDRKNPGSWKNVFFDFAVPADFESIGKLDDILKSGVEKYKNIIIDEAHRFRNENTEGYKKLSEICRGKRVILITATPFNNTPMDILNLIKLFQSPRKSNIPGVANLEAFFTKLNNRLKNIDRQENYDEYIKVTRENAKLIREKILKHIMVRRTRSEIEKYFADDLKKNKIKFPKVQDPFPLFYQFNEEEDNIFMETIRLITQELKYARYMPLLYYKEKISQLEEQSQKNMGGFMKVLLVKRLESSFYAFSKTIDRFIQSYERFIREFEKGNVYVSKKYINRIFELLEDGDDILVQTLIEEGKAEKYSSKDFKDNFIKDLKSDLQILKRIKNMWSKINRDPKIEKLIDEFMRNEILKNKVIIFTESQETAEYLSENLSRALKENILLFTGKSTERDRDAVIENFDDRAKIKKDDYRILITTEVLSEGVNLHRANVVINYDIPWNPTRMIQRIGRVNRVDTKFDTIYVFNFFPTKQANDQIKLKELAKAKIEAFLTLLGGDAAILTEGEPVDSHELFDKLVSAKIFIQEDEEVESELKYLKIIREIKEKDPQLFEKIKHLPAKARSAKLRNQISNQLSSELFSGESFLLTFFRKGKLQKFFLVSEKAQPVEVDFVTAAKVLECSNNEQKETIPLNFYDLLEKNKLAFYEATTEVPIEPQKMSTNQKYILSLLKILLKSPVVSEHQKSYLLKLKDKIEEGAIPKKIINHVTNLIKEKLTNKNPLDIVPIFEKEISSRFLEEHFIAQQENYSEKREIILSLYLK
ncbi:helicase domain protein [Caldicellulosiruptor hydrothermalis 108]|uniref:Helicase domain protein n=1 Tax=Caldicellulosiruptor hydrothermalis (strain DSM 18901 / VKM B-2411 / 108) TaxID=632292 RepID=E4QB62_CALH1|nr:helicase-related protein [Caldicellulosiruptor hydrothermalis]ADQ06040.1 helicase domain protein [Caldicellulosiruptor hydrothermalis 108]